MCGRGWSAFSGPHEACYTGAWSGGWIFSSSWLTKPAARAKLTLARKIASNLLSLIFPDDCRICGEPLREAGRVPVCNTCLAKPAAMQAEFFCVCCRTPFLNAFPLDQQGRCALCRLGLNGYDAAYTFGPYEGELRHLIHLLKYGRIQTLARPLGKFLRQALPREERFDLIVPVPLHWRKRWTRGFNQSELLAREIARNTALPVRKCLRRTANTAAQAGLTNAKRRANVSGAFRVKRNAALDGLRVLMIDDVMTTGATAAACARALKQAGAAYVALLTVARADRRMAAAGGASLDRFVPDSQFSGSSADAKSRSLA